MDSLCVVDPRRAGDRRAAGSRGPSLRPAGARVLPAPLGDLRSLLRDRQGTGPRGLSRRTREASSTTSGGPMTPNPDAAASAARTERLAAELRAQDLDAPAVDAPA